MQTSSARIRTLDGWRGIAILLVLVAHTEAGLLGRAWKYNWMDIGQHGVTIFFVLSGYLITSRLLAGDVTDLRSFYIRRFFRLMPAAWTYLLFVGAFAFVLRLHLIGHDVLACLLLFRNYVQETPANAMTSHFWSLSIEEQYYLVWPAILLLCTRRRALLIACTLACACAIYRLIFWSWILNHAPCSTQARIDSLLVGSALGLFLESPRARMFVRQYAQMIGIVGLLVLLGCIGKFHKLMPFSESIAIAGLLASTSIRPESIAGRILEWRHLAFVGSISYSLYVWQELFLVPHWGPLAPVMIGLLPVATFLSYRLIEEPCRRFGTSLAAHSEPVGQDQLQVYADYQAVSGSS